MRLSALIELLQGFAEDGEDPKVRVQGAGAVLGVRRADDRSSVLLSASRGPRA